MLAVLGVLGAGFVAVILWALSQASDVEEAVREGRLAGVGSEDRDCLAAAMAKLEERSPRWLSVYETTFLTTCLEESRATEAFCADVPDSLTDEGIAWSEARCRDVEASSMACQSLLVVVQMVCAERRESAEPDGEDRDGEGADGRDPAVASEGESV